MDLQLAELLASCHANGRETPCIGPADLLLELTFGPDRGRQQPGALRWPQRSSTELLQGLDSWPTVSLAVVGSSCPVRASVAQVAFLAEHGLTWGRWFALRQAESLPTPFGEPRPCMRS